MIEEQPIIPTIPENGQYDVVRTGGDIDPGWSLDHTTYNPDTGTVVAYKPQYDDAGKLLGNLEKQVNREAVLDFNSPENKEARRQEQLREELGESAIRHEVDSPYAQRLEKLFAPLKIEKTAVSEKSYDALLDPNNFLQNNSIESAAVRTNSKQRGRTTEESLKVAHDEYMKPLLDGAKDVAIAKMIQRAAHNMPLSPDNAMQLLREDSSLRKEIGSYLLDKLKSSTALLPERVARNAQKNANMPGYENIPNMSSHEYVALLALAKLDGTFSYEGYLQDAIQHDASGNVTLGQHRAAADLILQK
jgi:hypothetical protein